MELKDNMEKRPKCEGPNCNSEGFVFGFGKILCGTCFLDMQKFQQKKQEKEWDDFELSKRTCSVDNPDCEACQ